MVIKLKELKQYLYQIYFGKSNIYKIKILGIILFTLGIGLFWNPLGLNNNIAVTLILFAIFIFLFFPEKSVESTKDVYIFSFLTTWLVIIAFVTNGKNFDVFFLSVVIGMLIIKEFANDYLTHSLKKRLFILTLVFFSLSMILVAERIISFFNI